MIEIGTPHINILYPGDVTLFPRGLLHFEINVGKETADYISALNSQNPGTLVGTHPPPYTYIHIPRTLVYYLLIHSFIHVCVVLLMFHQEACILSYVVVAFFGMLINVVGALQSVSLALFQVPARALATSLNASRAEVADVASTLFPYGDGLKKTPGSGCIPGRDITTLF